MCNSKLAFAQGDIGTITWIVWNKSEKACLTILKYRFSRYSSCFDKLFNVKYLSVN